MADYQIYHDELDRIQAALDDAEYLLSKKIRAELVIPFCEKTGMAFLVVAGLWSFETKETQDRIKAKNDTNPEIVCWNSDSIRNAGMDKKMWDILSMPLASSPGGYDYGSYIEPYTPTTFGKSATKNR